MKPIETLEQEILKAVKTRVAQLADEEIGKAVERVKSRIVEEVATGISPAVLKNISQYGGGEISIRITPK